MLAFVADDGLDMVVARARHFLLFPKPLRLAYRPLILACLLDFVVSHPGYIFGDEVGPLRLPEQIGLLTALHLYIVAAHAWMVLEASGRFGPRYRVLFAGRLRRLVRSRSRKFRCLVILTVVLHVEGHFYRIFALVLVSGILNRRIGTSAGPGASLLPSNTLLLVLGMVYCELFLRLMSGLIVYFKNA